MLLVSMCPQQSGVRGDKHAPLGNRRLWRAIYSSQQPSGCIFALLHAQRWSMQPILILMSTSLTAPHMASHLLSEFIAPVRSSANNNSNYCSSSSKAISAAALLLLLVFLRRLRLQSIINVTATRVIRASRLSYTTSVNSLSSSVPPQLSHFNAIVYNSDTR